MRMCRTGMPLVFVAIVFRAVPGINKDRSATLATHAAPVGCARRANLREIAWEVDLCAYQLLQAEMIHQPCLRFPDV